MEGALRPWYLHSRRNEGVRKRRLELSEIRMRRTLPIANSRYNSTVYAQNMQRI